MANIDNILFTGDLFLGGDLLDNRKQKGVFHNALRNANFIVANLEQAVSDHPNEENKSTLHSNTGSVSFLVENKITAVSLANNHIQDKCEEGIFDTFETLKENGILYFGAGKNIYEASRFLNINDDYCLLSYCDHSKKYLKKIKIAGENSPGVNPLSFEKIRSDINKLPKNKKVFILIHWGYENVYLQPYENIVLAKKILEIEQVEAIIGNHPHKIQGMVKHNGKRAYMSLGNFIFPNFVMKPRTKITYDYVDSSKMKSTKEYHPVFSKTYKKWKKSNRISLLLSFDLENSVFKEYYAIQDENNPLVKELDNREIILQEKYFRIKSKFLKLPKNFYKIIYSIEISIHIFKRYFNVLAFYVFKERRILEVLKLSK